MRQRVAVAVAKRQRSTGRGRELGYVNVRVERSIGDSLCSRRRQTRAAVGGCVAAIEQIAAERIHARTEKDARLHCCMSLGEIRIAPAPTQKAGDVGSIVFLEPKLFWASHNTHTQHACSCTAPLNSSGCQSSESSASPRVWSSRVLEPPDKGRPNNFGQIRSQSIRF